MVDYQINNLPTMLTNHYKVSIRRNRQPLPKAPLPQQSYIDHQRRINPAISFRRVDSPPRADKRMLQSQPKQLPDRYIFNAHPSSSVVTPFCGCFPSIDRSQS